MSRKYDFSNKNTNILTTSRAVIYNKYVLYVVFVFALLDLLNSAVKGDYLYCTIFILVGFVTAFFNKNMTVILTITIAVSNIISSILRGTVLKVEGFEGEEEEEEVEGFEGEEEEEEVEGFEGDGEEDAVYDNSEPSETPAHLMEKLKENALDLQDAQKQIINGFEKIEPYMNQAETIIGDIQATAKTIQEMRNKALSK
jgi:hypothetical protein